MSQSITILTLSIVATAAVSEHRFIAFDGAYSAAGTKALGVAETDAAIGDTLSVNTIGTAVVEAGAAISIGDDVEVGTNGKAITKAAGIVVGVALEAATADGNKIEVLLKS